MTVSVKPKPKSKDIFVSDLDQVCVQGVTFYRNAGDSDAESKVSHLRELLTEAQGYKEKYQWLCKLLEEEQQEAQETYDSMKSQSLDFSTVEAEGFLRAMNLVKKLIVYVEENS